ncbi:hypothetical protein [Sinomicrobium oceani]|uniref:hypothetical protein n=1 Tax=Sinomicrobium oceani TaxID=1150368 RepID=UPI0038B64DCD
MVGRDQGPGYGVYYTSVTGRKGLVRREGIEAKRKPKFFRCGSTRIKNTVQYGDILVIAVAYSQGMYGKKSVTLCLGELFYRVKKLQFEKILVLQVVRMRPGEDLLFPDRIYGFVLHRAGNPQGSRYAPVADITPVGLHITEYGNGLFRFRIQFCKSFELFLWPCRICPGKVLSEQFVMQLVCDRCSHSKNGY